jgi:hypothetical protein
VDNLEPAALFFIVTGCLPALRRHATSRSIADGTAFPEVAEHETVAERFLPLV